jgi:hypothetical protein
VTDALLYLHERIHAAGELSYFANCVQWLMSIRHMTDGCPSSREVAISEGYRQEGRYTATARL